MFSLKKCLFRSSPHFLIDFWFFCCWAVWAISMFWKLRLCQLHYLQTFPPSFYILFMISFAVQKFISLIRFHLFIFAFIFIALGDWPEKILVYFVICLHSLLGVLWSPLTFKFLNHFEFIFVHGVRMCCNFFDLHVAVQLFQHHLLKTMSFPHRIFCFLCQGLMVHRCVSLFHSILFQWFIVYVLVNTMLFSLL